VTPLSTALMLFGIILALVWGWPGVVFGAAALSFEVLVATITARET